MVRCCSLAACGSSGRRGHSPQRGARVRVVLDRYYDSPADARSNQATVDWFEAQAASPALVSLLRKALGRADDMDIRWERA